MTTPRRTLLLAAPALALGVPALAQAPAADPRLAERAAGQPDAPVTVIEYFSLTCGHCANFHRDTLPQVKRELIEPGRARLVFRDFPLDQVALTAAAVARSLPPERYEPFVGTLFQTQERWAFGQNPREELARMAALAGMPRAAFDAAVADQALQRAILEQRLEGQRQHNVNSTPTFVFGGRTVPGNIPFDRFASLVAETR